MSDPKIVAELKSEAEKAALARGFAILDMRTTTTKPRGRSTRHTRSTHPLESPRSLSPHGMRVKTRTMALAVGQAI
jgi:hypothetical protein